MKVDLAYGDTRRSVIVPADVTVDYIIPRELPGIENVQEAVERAFSQPVGTRLPLDGSDESVLLVVSDLTRGGGTKEILPASIVYLESIGVNRDRMRILVARGTHRKLTKQEKKYFRTEAFRGIRIDEHDCDDAATMSALLLTERGTPVRVNKALKEAGLVLLISPVSFHYFAGFGGGRKLILPGSADRAAILANHRLSLIDGPPVRLAPGCRSGNLDGNPVSDDMFEVLAALTNVYALNFFSDTGGNPVFVNAGDPVRSHENACDAYREAFHVPIESPYGVVIAGCGGHPYDINLLQAHKALRHAADAAAPGGTIVFHAKCGEGMGSDSLRRALEIPRDEFFDKAYERYDLNNQAGISLRTLTEEYRVVMVSDIDEAAQELAGMVHCTNVEACLAEALELRDTKRVAVIPFGGQTLPYVKRSDAS